MFCNHKYTNNLFKYHNKLQHSWQFLSIGLPRIFTIDNQKHILFCANCGKLKNFGITKTSSTSFKANYPSNTVDLINLLDLESRIDELYNKKYATSDVNLMNQRIKEYRENVVKV